MYKHHEDSIIKLIDHFKVDKNVIAVILGGSVAKGCERADSDLDAMVVVTDEKYNELKNENRLTECISGECTYEEGYFDVKYMTKEYLTAVASHGSEPSRNAFLKSKCLYTKDVEIIELVKKIPVYQKQEQQEKMLSFYSGFALSNGYFWDSSENNTYLRMKTVTDIVYFCFRLLLQENEVLFTCHKSMMMTVSNLENKPENIIEKSETFMKNPTNETKDDFVNSIFGFIKFQPPKDFSAVLTRYTADNELWWYKSRPVITEW